MSAQINDGGPAFPRADQGYNNTHNGMSLRDWFAGQSLVGILSRDLVGNAVGNQHINHANVRHDPTPSTLARNCYAYADAMLKAREARTNDPERP